MNNFTSDLDVRYIDGTRWEVRETFTYRVGHADADLYVRVHRGFITDFASIPIGVRAILRSPGGRWDKPAVVHDWLYKFAVIYETQPGQFVPKLRPVTRKEADDIFLEAMGVLDTGWFHRHVIYAGVRVGGWWAWRKHRRAEAELDED